MHRISAARLLRPISHGSIALREIYDSGQRIYYVIKLGKGRAAYQLVDGRAVDGGYEHGESRQGDGEELHGVCLDEGLILEGSEVQM